MHTAILHDTVYHNTSLHNMVYYDTNFHNLVFHTTWQISKFNFDENNTSWKIVCIIANVDYQTLSAKIPVRVAFSFLQRADLPLSSAPLQNVCPYGRQRSSLSLSISLCINIYALKWHRKQRETRSSDEVHLI